MKANINHPTLASASAGVSNIKWLAVIAVLLVAAWFRTFRLDTVPPGPHFDAIINAQIVQEFIWPALPAWLRPAASSPAIPWLTIQKNPNGPDLQEHAWLYQVTLAATMGTIGRNVLGMRFPDLAWGMLGVSACYALARRLFGRNVALLATAAQAVSFWSVFLGRTGLRAVTIVPLLALAGCAFWDAGGQSSPLAPLPNREGGTRSPASMRKRMVSHFLLSGALLGLSIYGYLSARPMALAFVAFAVFLGLARYARWQRLLPGMVAFLAAAALVAAPLVLYLSAHPEENLRLNMVSGPLQDLIAGRPAAALQTGLATLGMFVWQGDPQWQYNVAGRPVFDPMGAVLFVVGVGLAVWYWRRPKNSFALIWLAASLLPGMLSKPAPHFARTVAAQVVTYAFVGLGAAELMHVASRASLGWLKGLGYAGLAAWLLGFAAWNYQGYFLVWANNGEVIFFHQREITEMARYLDRRADTTPVAACTIFVDEHEDFFRSPRETFAFILRRTDLPVRWFDCRTSLVIPAGGRARIMFPGSVPYSAWLGKALTPWMTWSTSVHDDLVPDGTLYTLDAARPLATEIISLTQTSQVEWSPEAGVTGPAPLPTDVGHSLEFLGYRVDRTRLKAGQDVHMLTYWRVQRPPPMFLNSFIHLLSDPYHIVAQVDGQVLLADTLQPGDVFIHDHRIKIPPDTPPGTYRLSVGWYVVPAMQRLTVYDGPTPRGDRLMLQEITLTR